MVVLVCGVLAFAMIRPFDVPITEAGAWLQVRLPNDLRREWTGWEQYGQVMAAVVTGLIVYLLDPARRRQIFDLVFAMIIGVIPLLLSRLFIGRFRPTDNAHDPSIFFRTIGDTQFGIDHPSSFLSAHVMYAVILSVFISHLYPKLGWLSLVLTLVVASGRIVFGGHWATDVVVGATLGWVVGSLVINDRVGGRVFEVLRTSLIRSDGSRKPNEGSPDAVADDNRERAADSSL